MSKDVNALPRRDDQFAGGNRVDVENAVIHANDPFLVVLPRIVGLLIHMNAVREVAEDELRGVEAIAPDAVDAKNRRKISERTRLHQHVVHNVFVANDLVVVTRRQHVHYRQFIADRQSVRKNQLHSHHRRAEVSCIDELANGVFLLAHVASL